MQELSTETVGRIRSWEPTDNIVGKLGQLAQPVLLGLLAQPEIQREFQAKPSLALRLLEMLESFDRLPVHAYEGILRLMGGHLADSSSVDAKCRTLIKTRIPLPTVAERITIAASTLQSGPTEFLPPSFIDENDITALPDLTAALDASCPSAAAVAANALQIFRQEAAPAIPNLLALLREGQDGWLLFHTSRALSAIGPTAIEPIFAEMALEPRSFASHVVALVGMGEAAFPHLSAALAHENPRVRAEAVRAIGAIVARGHPPEMRIQQELVPQIVPLVQDPVAAVRAAALGALHSFGDIAIPFAEAARADPETSVRFASDEILLGGSERA